MWWWLVVPVVVVLIYLLLPYVRSVSLNLTIEGMDMAKLGDTFTARIAPTAGSGEAAPVFNIEWTVAGTGYTVIPAADGMSAVYTAAALSGGNGVSVTAKSAAGASLSDGASLPDVVQAIPEAVKLNLVVS